MMELLVRIKSHAIEQGSKPAFESPEGRLSYRQLDQLINDACVALIDSGCKRLGIMLDNEPTWVVWQLAAFKAKIPVVPMPLFFSESQTRHQLEDCGVDLLLCRDPERVSSLGLQFQPHTAHPLAYSREAQTIELPVGTALITYTSGSTGDAKGVCLGSDHLDQLCNSLHSVIAPLAIQRHACITPMAVLLENLAGTLLTLYAGATCLLFPSNAVGLVGSGQLDIPTFAGFLQRNQPDSLILVPELLKALVGIVADGAYQHRLKFVAVGGSRIAASLLSTSEKLGIPVYQGYGLSECGSVVTLNSPMANRVGSVGRALPHCSLTTSTDGEILVSGTSMLGYVGNGNCSTDYIATGDIGHLDTDGYLYIQGRKKNVLINSFGRNLSPEWIESELGASPVVAQACLFGDGRPLNVALITPAHGATFGDIDTWICDLNRELPDYARIGLWVPTYAPFSPENGQLTGNGRTRRQQIYKDYEAELNRCYV